MKKVMIHQETQKVMIHQETQSTLLKQEARDDQPTRWTKWFMDIIFKQNTGRFIKVLFNLIKKLT